MTRQQINNPLHGITLQHIVDTLVEHYGWKELGKRINIRCFNSDPSVKSSLKFLRKTPWARTEVEELFISIQQKTHADEPQTAEASIWANRNGKS